MAVPKPKYIGDTGVRIDAINNTIARFEDLDFAGLRQQGHLDPFTRECLCGITQMLGGSPDENTNVLFASLRLIADCPVIVDLRSRMAESVRRTWKT